MVFPTNKNTIPCRRPACTVSESAVGRGLVVLAADPPDVLEQAQGLGVGLEAAHQVREGLDADLVLRPHALQLVAPDAPLTDTLIWIDAAVKEREFLGEFMRYLVETAGHALTVDVPHFGSAGHAPGTAVKLGIDPAKATVLPAA